jgi:hypothetical protein
MATPPFWLQILGTGLSDHGAQTLHFVLQAGCNRTFPAPSFLSTQSSQGAFSGELLPLVELPGTGAIPLTYFADSSIGLSSFFEDLELLFRHPLTPRLTAHGLHLRHNDHTSGNGSRKALDSLDFGPVFSQLHMSNTKAHPFQNV